MSSSKIKVGTVLDPELVTRAKALASRRQQAFSTLLENALRDYLARQEDSCASVVLSTWGLLPADHANLATALELDPYDD